MKLNRILCNATLALSLISAGAAEARLPRGTSSAIAERIESSDVTGVAQISVGGRTEYTGAFGLAERAFNTPMHADTRFPIASVTKIFASVLILQLADEGALQLDTPFGAYLPDYPGEGADRVTVRMLLNHTSGLAQFDTVGSYQEALTNGIPNYQQPLSSADLLRICCSGPLAVQPGARFDYNNADYFVLGQIVERLTGVTFEQRLRSHVLEPLGLHDTGMLHSDAIQPRLATTYFHRDDTDTLIAAMPVYWDNFYAAGGMYSTAGDISRFAEALYRGDLISHSSRDAFLTPALDEYGLGLWVYSFQRGGRTYRVAKRPGSVMGAQAVVYRLIEQDITIVLLANTNIADLDVLAQRIAEQLIDANVQR